MRKAGLVIAGVLLGWAMAVMLPAGAHHQTSFENLRDRVRRLELKAQDLNRQGVYLGMIDGDQVWVPVGCELDPARWGDVPWDGINC